MTGAGAPGAPGIIRCLKEDPSIQLTVADADEHATGRYLAGHFITIPRGDDPDFAELLLQVCKKEKINLVLPLVTRELLPLALNRDRFREAGITVMVSSPEAITIANNKVACCRFLQEQGIAVPQFYTALTLDAFVHAAAALGHPWQSFCFKPAVANGSRGFRIVSDSLDEADQLFNHKPYNVHITYAHAVKILSSQSFPELLVCEYLPGDEYSVDCIADEGNAVLVVPRLRRKMVNGISVQGVFVKDEKIISYCKEIISALRLHGNIGIQVKYAASGEPLLVEINPRVQGTIVAALGAGVNLPLLAVQQALGMQLREKDLQVRWGTQFSRYWTEQYY